MNISIKVYPVKIYKTFGRACKYGEVLPSFVQPVFEELDGLMYAGIGFAIGPNSKDGHYLSYRKII